MTARGWVAREIVVGVAVATALLFASAPVASASSGSLSVSDAGNGSMSVKAEATRSGCGESLCAWYAAVTERHSTLPCANDLVFRAGVVGFATDAGTVRDTIAFKPFFPRAAKLCLYVLPLVGKAELVAETTYKSPDGYGMQRSKELGCDRFSSQAAAQYYLYLYPEDPSRLDPGRSGTACEQNACPCDAEPIPAEPPPTVNQALCKKARAHKRAAQTAVRKARRQLRQAEVPAVKQRWNRSLKKRQAALRKAKRQQRKACSAPSF
jgi:hypothetical protein